MKLLNLLQLVKSINNTSTTEQRKDQLLKEVKTLSKDLLEKMKKHGSKENLNDFKEKLKTKNKEHLEYFKKIYEDRIYSEKNKVELMKIFVEFYDKEIKFLYEISEQFKVPINMNEYRAISNRQGCLNEIKIEIDKYYKALKRQKNIESFKKEKETLQNACDFLICLNEKFKADKGERIKSLKTETTLHGIASKLIPLLEEFEKEKLDKEDAEKLKELLQKLKKLKDFYDSLCYGPLLISSYSSGLSNGFDLAQNNLIHIAGYYIDMKSDCEAKLTTILKAGDTSCLNSQGFLEGLSITSQRLEAPRCEEIFGETGQKLKKVIDGLYTLSKEKHTHTPVENRVELHFLQKEKHTPVEKGEKLHALKKDKKGSKKLMIVGLAILGVVLVLGVSFYFIIKMTQ